MHIHEHHVSLPAVLVAASIIAGWALANEYLHAAYNYVKGVLYATAFMTDDTAFDVGVFMMAVVSLGAAACIIIMGIKKKE